MANLIGLLALFTVLIQNELPVLAIGGIFVCIARGFGGKITQKNRLKRIELAITVCLVYWILNYWLTQAGFNNLVSYHFLRRDGALLITYPTFFFLLGWTMKPRLLRLFWLVFLMVLSLMACCGVAILIGLPFAYLLGRLHIVGMTPEFAGSRLFYAWYQAHDTAGGIYTMACVVLLALLLDGKFNRKFRVYVWGMFFCCLAGLALTYSRSGYLGLMAGMFVLLPVRQLRRTFKIGIAIAVPLIVVLLSNSSFLSRIDTITDPNWGTNATRFVLWRDALYDFSESPIVGIGLGRYNDLRRQFKGVPGLVYVATAGEILNNSTTAHDSYLHFLAEGGIVGLFVTMLIWWFAWKELSFFERQLPRSHLHPFHRAGKAALAAMLVFCIFDHVLGSGSNVLFLMSLVGLTIAASRKELAEALRVAEEKRQLPRLARRPAPAQAVFSRQK